MIGVIGVPKNLTHTQLAQQLNLVILAMKYRNLSMKLVWEYDGEHWYV